MDNYKPNSRSSKKNTETVKKEKVEKIVKGTVKSKKKNSLLSLFITDEVVDIKSYILFEVLVPTVKRAVSDIVTNGIEILLNGETGGSRKASKASKISYRSYYEDRDRKPDRARERVSSGYSYDDVILETKGEAVDVLTRMDELIEIYGNASIGDLYDLVGISSQYTDNYYGWTDLRTATSVRVRDGYLLKMPRVVPLN